MRSSLGNLWRAPFMVAVFISLFMIVGYAFFFADLPSGILYRPSTLFENSTKGNSSSPRLLEHIGDILRLRSSLKDRLPMHAVYRGRAPLLNKVNSSDRANESQASNGTTLSGIESDKTSNKLGVNAESPKDQRELCSNVVSVPPEGPRRKPNMENTSLEKVGVEIFGALYDQAKERSAVANESVAGLAQKRRATGDLMANATMIDRMIAEMGLMLDVDDYRLLPGGHWIPISCRPRWKVAIVVPFRNRFKNLPVFLRYIVPLLKIQRLEFSIFITEQRNNIRFNRAMLMNVGFVETLNFTNYDCVVFHDVDHVALDVRNYFGCEHMPRHFISGERMWKFKILYNDLFGGVTGLTTAQFRGINGLPNVYWGWGGEDDDFFKRVRAKGYNRSRPEGEIGYFDTVDHNSNSTNVLNKERFCLLKTFKQRIKEDGLSNLAYSPPIIELHPLYTNISVDIRPLPWNRGWSRCGQSQRA